MEAFATDLQSAPIGHSGNLPWCACEDSSQPGGIRNLYAAHPLPGRGPRPRQATPAPQPEEEPPMADSSFDVVSKYDKQEVANAVNNAAKELSLIHI